MSETCPFCQTQINNGAIVCIGCGAKKTYKGRTGHPFIPLVLIIFGGLAFGGGKEGGLLMVAAGIFLLWLSYKNAGDMVWRR